MKIIEEAGTRYACMVDGHPGYDPAIRKAFIEGAAYIMSFPLCERLTSEERANIREYDKLLCKERDKAFAIGNITAAGGYGFAVVMLRDIFGAAMFEEKGGEE